MTLKVEQVTSGYHRIPVIQGIDFQVQEGQMMGLIGLNGAGKSTLLKTILGLLPCQEGEIRMNGITIKEDHHAYASQIAYIPETPILYEELTLREHLEMTALGYQIPVQELMRRAQPLLEIFRLDQQLDWFPSHFSKGMKQKVMIICALVTQAKLYIIDEPFLGLDPLAINHFTQLLKQVVQAGASVIFTTHILSIAEELCDDYLLLQKGQLVASGNLSSLRQQFNLPTANLTTIYLEMTKMGDEHA